MLRTTMIDEMGKVGDEETVSFCQSLFESRVKEGTAICAQIRGPVLQTVARHTTTVEQVEQLIDLFKTSPNDEERSQILVALGCCTTEQNVGRVLEFSLSDDIPRGLVIHPLRMLATNFKLGPQLWKFCTVSFFFFSLQLRQELYLG